MVAAKITGECFEELGFLRKNANCMVAYVNREMCLARLLLGRKAASKLAKFRIDRGHAAHRAFHRRRRELNRSFATRVLREWRREAIACAGFYKG